MLNRKTAQFRLPNIAHMSIGFDGSALFPERDRYSGFFLALTKTKIRLICRDLV